MNEEVSWHEQMARDNVALYRRVVELEDRDRQRLSRIAGLKIRLQEGAAMSNRLREELAAYAHLAWGGWMSYLFSKSTFNPDGSVTIPPALVQRWTRQVYTAYQELPPGERASDLVEADQMLEIVRADRARYTDEVSR